MTEGALERKRLDHVVLPRRLPGLALLERYFPSPADNVLDAELASFAASGDTVLDPWSGTGWTARRAVSHGMRVVAAEASPFAQMAAQAFLLAPEVAAVDAAFAQLSSSRRVDIPLRQHIEELYASRCPACNRPVLVEEFIWPRDGDAPGRKVYRCTACDISLGGPDERVAPVDEADYAKLGLEPPAPAAESPTVEPAADADEDLPPAPFGLIGDPLPDDEPPPLAPLGEPGGPPPPQARLPDPPVSLASEEGPRYASTVRPAPIPTPVGTDPRQGLAYQQLQDRFPVLDERREVVEELLDLYTSRNLYALQAIANKIDAEFRDQPLAAVFRLALAGCLLPASRLNGYPGRVASLRISGGHVRQPASRHHREVNVWRLFEVAYQDVRTALAALGRDRRPVRFAADLDELGGMAAANLLWIRCRPAVVGQYLPPDSIDLVIGAPPPPESVDELSFEYLATAWLLGREAAETLRLEPLFGGGSRADGAEVTAFRHALASAAGALKPGGWFSVLLEGDDPDRVLAVAMAGAAADLELVHAIPRESGRSGDAVTLHFRRASAEDRLRDAVRPRPLRLGASDGHLTYPELAGAIEKAAVGLLRDRGEPAGLSRIACAVLLELERTGLLRRLVQARPPGEGEDDQPLGGDVVTDRVERGGPALLAVLLREELWREDHPTLLRVGDPQNPSWWLREPELAADGPLADRVEWATFSLLTTAGRLDESSFLDRIFALFPGTASPDEELVRACLGAYAQVDDRGQLRSEEDLSARVADHTRVLAAIIEFGHRLGLRAWVSRREQERPWKQATLGDLLRDDERRTYLPLVIRAPAEVLGAVDALWYVRNRSSYLFEVEWTAMLGEAVLRRGAQVPTSDQQARFLVIPAERTDLLRLKLARSPWARTEIERQNWHVLKWPHLEALVTREGARIEWLEPMIGLDPLVERGGKQLTMFGE
ncbi:MAG: hypothetical protein EHM90_01530 [Chloroflexi bacterium]|nr:MAG: hypothetical protein EHM90_01530 [Chloroflexota bacterium]